MKGDYFILLHTFMDTISLPFKSIVFLKINARNSMHIYFIIAVVFIMICILHVIYCRAIALVANVTCWL